MSATTADTPQVLLEHHLKALRLPTVLREYDKLARTCAVEKAMRSVTLQSVRTYCVPGCSLCGRVVWTRNFAMNPSAPASRALSVGMACTKGSSRWA